MQGPGILEQACMHALDYASREAGIETAQLHCSASGHRVNGALRQAVKVTPAYENASAEETVGDGL